MLFVDADLEASAEAVGALVGPVARGDADLAIAVAARRRVGRRRAAEAHGVVVGLARRGVEELTGSAPTQPLSGMRCLSPAAIAAATAFARGLRIEVGVTIDVLDAGLTVHEVACDLRHREIGTDWRSQVHRAASVPRHRRSPLGVATSGARRLGTG